MATDSTDPGEQEISKPVGCWFCNELDQMRPGQTICDREACREIEREMIAEHNRAEWAEYWLAWRVGIVGRCKGEEFHYSPNRLERWFYTFKVYLCLAFHRRRYYDWNDPAIEVATMESHSDGYGWHAKWLKVGYGIFRNWGYEIDSDGDSLY